MSNMSYCRFQNTSSDLRDCEDALSEISSLDELSAEEKRAAQTLLKCCKRLAEAADDLL